MYRRSEQSCDECTKYSVGYCSKPTIHGFGFTLIELLAVVAITCILLVAATSSFSKLIQSNRVSAESHALFSLLMLGRSEAVKCLQQVILCKSADGVSCNTARDSSWNQGAVLFRDANANRLLDSADWIVRSEPPFNRADSIQFSAGDSLVYRPDGTSTGGTFTISSGRLQTKVIVSLAGRARIE